MDFLKRKSKEIIIVLSMLALFFFVFIVFDLSLSPFILSACIVIFIFSIYLVVDFSSYKKESSLKEKLEEQIQINKRLRNEHLLYQADLESYFLLWVHQIKTPITAAKLLLKNGETDKTREEIIEIENYTNLAMSYLKLQHTDTDMVFKEVAVDELLQPLIKKYAIQFIHHQTKLHYTKIQDKVLTDIRWATIMIEQLLNNALKYAKGKDVWITYDEKSHTLSIQDNGSGISASDLPKIFDRGYSGFNGQQSDKASGIGLYITRQISNQLNHPITVSSEIGVGTTFTIHFVQSSS